MKEKLARKLVSHAVSTEQIREELTIPYYIGKKRLLIGADGYRMVLIKIDKPEKKMPLFMECLPSPKSIIASAEIRIEDLYEASLTFANTKYNILRLYLDKDKILCRWGFKENDRDKPPIFSEVHIPLSSPITGSKSDVRVAVSPRFLFDTAKALKAIKDVEHCTISFSKPSEPVVIKAGDYTEIIMPMYVNW